MNALLESVVNEVLTMDWPAFLQGAGAIWMAVVATIALTTWSKQLRAEKQIGFIDELTNVVHEYILLMRTPVSQLEFAKIGIDAHRGISLEDPQHENSEVIAFIERKGVEHSKRIFESLAAVRPVLSKMQSLAVKGQVFGMQGYERCFNACEMLAWSFNQLEAFGAAIGNPYMNWDNELVQKAISSVHKIDPQEIRDNLSAQSIAVIAFSKDVYKRAIQ